ncbi:hypothetical protein [Crateriforma conspicua]|uniref:hypothetical protein n=1 Tax=Crateriforma TaxID=2714592 RepID=UPI0018CEB23A|nr:hypothetical protein [Crateriforma conspicua]
MSAAFCCLAIVLSLVPGCSNSETSRREIDEVVVSSTDSVPKGLTYAQGESSAHPREHLGSHKLLTSIQEHEVDVVFPVEQLPDMNAEFTIDSGCGCSQVTLNRDSPDTASGDLQFRLTLSAFPPGRARSISARVMDDGGGVLYIGTVELKRVPTLALLDSEGDPIPPLPATCEFQVNDRQVSNSYRIGQFYRAGDDAPEPLDASVVNAEWMVARLVNEVAGEIYGEDRLSGEQILRDTYRLDLDATLPLEHPHATAAIRLKSHEAGNLTAKDIFFSYREVSELVASPARLILSNKHASRSLVFRRPDRRPFKVELEGAVPSGIRLQQSALNERAASVQLLNVSRVANDELPKSVKQKTRLVFVDSFGSRASVMVLSSL